MGFENNLKKVSKGNIGFPDEIKVSLVEGKEFKGNIMPKTKNENTLILKLNNGYNIGIEFKKIKEIKLIKKIKIQEKTTTKKINNQKKPEITIISTGGTIASKVDYITGGVQMLSKPEEFLKIAPELENIIKIKEIKNPILKGSEDLDFKDYQTLAEEIKKTLKNPKIKGIIITHGTDTLHYTAAALSFIFKGINKPIVLVGAQRSSDRGSADGVLNLTCATHLTISENKGIFVVMHENLNDKTCLAIKGTRVRKMHTERRDAFRPINAKASFRIQGNGEIEEINKTEFEENKLDYKPKMSKMVRIIKAYPESDPTIITHHINKGVKGIIIEGTGFGHVPLREDKGWKNELTKAIKKGIIIGMCSQTIYGRGNDLVYSNGRILKNLGIINCKDMFSEVAYIKLSWLLANYEKEDVKKLLTTNLVGELNERSIQGEFLI